MFTFMLALNSEPRSNFTLPLDSSYCVDYAKLLWNLDGEMYLTSLVLSIKYKICLLLLLLLLSWWNLNPRTAPICRVLNAIY